MIDALLLPSAPPPEVSSRITPEPPVSESAVTVIDSSPTPACPSGSRKLTCRLAAVPAAIGPLDPAS